MVIMKTNTVNTCEKEIRPKMFQYSSGVTLVELLIASALSITILGGMLHLMEGTKITSRLNESLSSIHLTGHYTLDTLRHALKYRGFEGCKRPVSLDPTQESLIDWNEGAEFTSITSSNFPLTNVAQSSLRGHEVDANGVWSPEPNADLVTLRDSVTPSPRPNSDVISVYYVSSDAVPLNTDMTVLSDNLQINDATLTFAQNDQVLIGDCSRSDIFEISNAPGSSLPITLEHADSVNASENLSYLFQTNAELRLAYVDTYYVGDTGRETENGDTVYALYRFRNGSSTEIVEGVENLQLLYGEELATGNVRYLTADDENLNMRVVSRIELGMLIYHQSHITQTDDTRSYALPGETILAPDDALPASTATHLGGRYLRKVFTETIHMLNRS